MAARKTAKAKKGEFFVFTSDCGDMSQAEVFNDGKSFPSVAAAQKAVDTECGMEAPEYRPNNVFIVQVVSRGEASGFEWK